MVTKKVRRHSGRYTPRLEAPKMKYIDMIENAEEPAQEYDDWTERRDGMRDWPGIERKKRELEKEKRILHKLICRNVCIDSGTKAKMKREEKRILGLENFMVVESDAYGRPWNGWPGKVTIDEISVVKDDS